MRLFILKYCLPKILFISLSLSLFAQSDVQRIEVRLEKEWKACNFDRVVELCDSLDQAQFTDQPAVDGYVLYWRGKALYELMQVPRALDQLHQSAEVFSKGGPAYRDQWARSMLALGDMSYDQGGTEQFRTTVLSVLAEADVSKHYRMTALAQLMFLFGETGEHRKADSIWQVADSFLSADQDTASEAAAKVYHVRALHLTRQKDYDGALWYANKSLDILTATNSGPLERMKAIGILSSAYSAGRKFREAIRISEAAINETDCNGLTFQKVTAVNSMNIGIRYMQLQEFDHTEAFLLESLRLLNACIEGPHLWKIQVGMNLTDLYARQKRVRETQTIARQTLELASELDLLTPELLYEIDFSLQRVEPNPLRALELVLKAYVTAETAFGERDYRTVSAAMSVASAYARSGDNINALKYHRKVESMMKGVGGHPYIPEVYEDLTQSSLDAQNLSAAQQFLDTSLHQLSEGSMITERIYDGIIAGPELFYLSGLIAQKKGTTEKDTALLLAAHENFMQAIQAIDFAITMLAVQQDQSSLVDMLHQYYRTAIDHVLALREIDTNVWDEVVFGLVEQSRNVVLRAHLGSALRTRATSIPDSVRQRQAKWMSQILLLQRKEQEADTQDRPDVHKELIAAKNAYVDQRARISRQYDSPDQVKDTTIPKLSVWTKTLDNHTGVISYFIADTAFWAFVIVRDKYQILRLTGVVELREIIAAQRQTILDFPGSIDKYHNLQQYNRLSRDLYQLLLSTAFKQEPGVTHWVIVPERELNYISFESLIGDDGKYLIEGHHTISYAIAAAPWSEAGSETARGMAFFAPDYSAASMARSDTIKSAVLASLVRSGSFVLPSPQAEAAHLHKLLNAEIFVDQHAAKSKFVSHANEFNLLHLSMHGIRDERNPMLSYLLFQNEPGQDADKLFLGEIYELSLPAELVFLAACQTASGPISDGEGIVSFSRALRYAGVSSTVTGLWNLPHQSTTTITTGFYSGLSEGTGKAEALKRAKQNYLETQNEPLLKHPYYWAGLVLQGESGPVRLYAGRDQYSRLFFGLGGLAVFCMSIWVWRKTRTRISY